MRIKPRVDIYSIRYTRNQQRKIIDVKSEIIVISEPVVFAAVLVELSSLNEFLIFIIRVVEPLNPVLELIGVNNIEVLSVTHPDRMSTSRPWVVETQLIYRNDTVDVWQVGCPQFLNCFGRHQTRRDEIYQRQKTQYPKM